MKKARQIALEILHKVEVKEAYSNILVNKTLNKFKLSKSDTALITELVYGVLRWRNTLDWILQAYSRRKIETLSPWIRNILRLGAYQLAFLNRIPKPVACNESVELAKIYGHVGEVRFVNAILRRTAEDIDKVSFPDLKEAPVKHIALKYSHPEWLVKKWLKRFGLNETISLCLANNQVPPFTIRVNTLKITVEDLKGQLKAEGIETQGCELVPEGLILRNVDRGQISKYHQQGLFVIQDEGSMLVSRTLDPQPGETILEACSAPGGKTTHIAQLMENRGRIFALDIHPRKLATVERSAKRLGIKIIKTFSIDARKSSEVIGEKVDRCLLDAPCSGTGVLRRRPEIKWRKTLEQLRELTGLQRELLEAVSKLVKSGGILVYSTCSLEREENEGIIERFLRDHNDFELSAEPEAPPLLKQGWAQLFPNVHFTDGIFIARLRRRG